MKIYRFLLFHLFFVAALAVVPIILMYSGNLDMLIPHFWLLFLYISGLTFIVILSVLTIYNANPELYAQAFLAGTVFKILAILIFILVFTIKTPVNKLVFASDFAYIYFLNTAFEVYGLLCNLRNQKLK